MTLCDYDSSSDSDSSTGSYNLSGEDFRYPHTGTPRNRSHVSKKRTWSETDDESDLPGVPNYRQVGGSYARFCYDSDLDSEEDSRETKRRRASNGKPVVPIAGGVRDLLVKCPTTPAPRPTTALRPRVYQPSASRFVNSLDEDLEYLALDDPSPLDGREHEPVPVAVCPAQARPFVHVYPAPKPTTSLKVRMIKAASPVEPKVAVPNWLGVASTWSFPSL